VSSFREYTTPVPEVDGFDVGAHAEELLCEASSCKKIEELTSDMFIISHFGTCRGLGLGLQIFVKKNTILMVWS
jgi:hypothetical protein